MRCAKTVLKGKFIAPNAYIGKEEQSQINSINSYLKKLGGKKEQSKPKTSRMKKIIKTRADINEIKSRKKYRNQ